MAIVNFSITKPLEDQIMVAIKNKGFQSKAEFFRFAAVRYLGNLNGKMTDDEEFAYLADKLRGLLEKKFAGKRLPSLKKQLGLS